MHGWDEFFFFNAMVGTKKGLSHICVSWVRGRRGAQREGCGECPVSEKVAVARDQVHGIHSGLCFFCPVRLEGAVEIRTWKVHWLLAVKAAATGHWHGAEQSKLLGDDTAKLDKAWEVIYSTAPSFFQNKLFSSSLSASGQKKTLKEAGGKLPVKVQQEHRSQDKF